MKALVYLRVSTEEQAEKGYSLQAQRTEGINKAIELGCRMENIYFFSDEGVSGAVLERPQLLAALNILKRKYSIEYFICYDSSRLSRNAAHQLIIIDEIKKSGAKLVFIKNSYQDNAEGRFQLTVMAAVDEYERARLKLRMEMGKRAKASQHKLTHNPGLYGYDFDSKTDTLNVNDEKVQNLRHIFRLLTERHMGPAEIAESLNHTGVPSPRMKQWNRVTVRRILSNPSYLGTLYIRRYDTRDCHLNKYKKKGEKERVKERPRDEWIPVQIPQIIDKDTWEKAQNILKKSKALRNIRNKSDFLLTSLIKCGICGSSMNCKKIEGESHIYRYYICTGKYKNMKEKSCRSMLIKAEDIENTIWDSICKTIKIFINKKIEFGNTIDKYIFEKESLIKDIVNRKEKFEKEKERIIIMFQKGYIKEEEMKKRLEHHEKMLESLNSDIIRKGWQDADIIKRVKTDSNEGRLPYIMKEAFNGLDSKGKRQVLKLMVSEITVFDSLIIIKMNL